MLSSIALVFSSIVAVTLVVPDPDAVARAYVDTPRVSCRRERPGERIGRRHLGGMPPLAGRRVVLVQPKSGEPVYLRLVKDTPP